MGYNTCPSPVEDSQKEVSTEMFEAGEPKTCPSPVEDSQEEVSTEMFEAEEPNICPSPVEDSQKEVSTEMFEAEEPNTCPSPVEDSQKEVSTEMFEAGEPKTCPSPVEDSQEEVSTEMFEAEEPNTCPSPVEDSQEEVSTEMFEAEEPNICPSPVVASREQLSDIVYDSEDSNMSEIFPFTGFESHPDRVFFDDSKQVYFRKIKKSETGIKGQKTKMLRVFDIKHACYFCEKLISKPPEHMEAKHKDEPEIKKLAELDDKTKKQERNRHLTLLRNKGDHKHNTKVLEQKCGELLLVRRPQGDGPYPKVRL